MLSRAQYLSVFFCHTLVHAHVVVVSFRECFGNDYFAFLRSHASWLVFITLPASITHLGFRALLFPDFVSTGFSRPFCLLTDLTFPAPEATDSFMIWLLLPFPDLIILLSRAVSTFTIFRLALVLLVIILVFSHFQLVQRLYLFRSPLQSI